MKTVLGIDPSLSCTGLAIISGGQLRSAGVIKGDDLRGAERLEHIYDGVLSWLQLLPDFDSSVAIEGYAHGAKFQREAMGEVGGVVRLAVHRFGLSYVEIAPASWQKQLLGSGRVDKNLRGAQLGLRYSHAINGVKFDSFDAVEAFAVALAGWQRVEGTYVAPVDRAKVRKESA